VVKDKTARALDRPSPAPRVSGHIERKFSKIRCCDVSTAMRVAGEVDGREDSLTGDYVV
jgi:hypothetical protein